MFRQKEEFALRSLNEEHLQMSLLSPLTVHLNLPPAEETPETTVMGQINFFFHICKNVKKVHFNKIQEHNYLCIKKLKKIVQSCQLFNYSFS